MITALCMAAVLAQGDRPFEFLSYKDLIFAVPTRNTWIFPLARGTDFPKGIIQLRELGLTDFVGLVPGSVEGFDRRTESFNVACVDFDHVLSWLANVSFPRHVSEQGHANGADRLLAHQLILQKDKGIRQLQIGEANAYSVDLDGSGKPVRLVEAWSKSRGHSPGIVYLDSPMSGPILLCYSRDGWPKLLTVADFMHDGLMEVIVGGITSSGRTVSMWRYYHGRVTTMVQYPK